MNHLVCFRYLIALDEHKHFSRAADACNITQPALSNALKALEESYGISIITRGRSFVGFTPEGQKVLESARRITREHETLQQEIHGSATEPAGHLAIGVIPSATPIAGRFAAMLRRKYRAITVEVRSVSSQDLETGVENGSLDMALGYAKRLHGRHHQLTTLHQYQEHYYLVRKRQTDESPHSGKSTPMSWVDVAKYPLCMLSKAMHNRHILDQAFREVGAVARAVIETNSISTLSIAVMAGDVCTIMPGALVDQMLREPGIEAHPLVSPQVVTDISWILPKTDRRSHLLQAAVAFAASEEWIQNVQQHAGTLEI